MAALVLVLAGCASSTEEEVDVADVVVGTGPDAEARLLAEVVAVLVTDAGLTPSVLGLADGEDARRALEVGDVDVLPSYTGQAWLRLLGRGDPPSDPSTSLARVREYDERDGLLWLRPRISREESLSAPPADATFAFVVQVEGGEVATPAADLTTMSQLAALLARLPDPVLCVDPAFAEREDGLAVVLEAYSVAPGSVEVRLTEPPDAVFGVARGGCVAGLTSATDGAAWLAGQRPLVDDLGVFPAFVVVPVVRSDALARHEELDDALAPMLEGLTTARLGRWNARVTAGEDPAVVAVDAVAELTGTPGP